MTCGVVQLGDVKTCNFHQRLVISYKLPCLHDAQHFFLSHHMLIVTLAPSLDAIMDIVVDFLYLFIRFHHEYSLIEN